VATTSETSEIERLAASIVLSRRDLAWYMQFVHGWRVRPHQELLVRALQALVLKPECWLRPSGGHDICKCDGAHECSECFICRVWRDKKLLAVMPPGWGKTDTLVEFIAWAIGIDPENAAYGFFSYNDNIATERAMAVRDTLWSKEPSEVTERYQMVFPVRPAPERPWSQERFFLWRKDSSRKDPTLVAAGVTGSVNARRLRGFVFDDPHNQENSATPYQRNQVWTSYKRAMETRLTSDGFQVGISTRWAKDDWAGRVADLRWPMIHVRALEADESTWPYEGLNLGFDSARLISLREEDAVSFYLQYQGEIIPEGGAVLATPKQVYFQRAQFTRIIQSWDTAVGSDRQHSESCCTTWGQLNGKAYWIDTWTGQLPYTELLNKVVEMDYKFAKEGLTPDVILIEQASNAEVLIPELRKSSGLGWKIKPVTVGGRGHTREVKIAAAAPYFQTHVVWPFEAEWKSKASGQILSYRGDGKFRGRDDIVMSAVQAIGYIFPSTGLGEHHPTSVRWFGREMRAG